MQEIKKKALKHFYLNGSKYNYYNIYTLEEEGYRVRSLPYSVKVLLESVLRQCDGYIIKEEHVRSLADWINSHKVGGEVPFKPARVILQDFTGVPAVLDLASMRTAMVEMKSQMANHGGETSTSKDYVDMINPEVPVDLVIDHSVQVDYYGSNMALEENKRLEFERNKERYQFLNWAQKSFQNFTVVPPSTGIVHQVNLEHLASVVISQEADDGNLIFPDTLVGTDSHTTMINGLGVLGWGVGGIEAEAGMLGQPSYFPIPEVVGVRLTGEMTSGATATDLALKITQLLRQKGVVGKFVEFFGEGIQNLALADRATIANMAPEYGATCGFFPVDEETLDYLILTGRSREHVDLIKAYLRENGMFYNKDLEPTYSTIIELDLSTISSSLAGPKRPQDLIPLENMKQEFIRLLRTPVAENGYGLTEEELSKEVEFTLEDGRRAKLSNGSLVIASITSCTNTSNPSVMLGAGLLAKKAVERGLTVPAHVKTSLAPGSRVVSSYLEKSGLQKYLDQLGFQVIGYGCATCIGNSGPLLPEISQAITENNLMVAAVLSGNRNFEGRIHSQVKANFLASPPLVVAYALAGTMNLDMVTEALGTDHNGKPVYLKDIWPTSKEIEEYMQLYVNAEIFQKEYEFLYESNELWNQIQTKEDKLYSFKQDSTYIQKPPFFQQLSMEPQEINRLKGLRVLAKFGNSITTDHISPAGAIGKNTPAGQYLLEHGVSVREFNTYGSRRGNHEVMMRGTFANIRIRNKLVEDMEGGYTIFWPTGETMAIYDACMKYKEQQTGLIVLAGKDYGMGSSRDWAAKGPFLLGVKAIIAESYERIHRSNLAMMGILPLQFQEGENADSLGLKGDVSFEIGIKNDVKPGELVQVLAHGSNGEVTEFKAILRFDSEVEVEYYRHGGILPMVLRKKLMEDYYSGTLHNI